MRPVQNIGYGKLAAKSWLRQRPGYCSFVFDDDDERASEAVLCFAFVQQAHQLLTVCPARRPVRDRSPLRPNGNLSIATSFEARRQLPAAARQHDRSPGEHQAMTSRPLLRWAAPELQARFDAVRSRVTLPARDASALARKRSSPCASACGSAHPVPSGMLLLEVAAAARAAAWFDGPNFAVQYTGAVGNLAPTPELCK